MIIVDELLHLLYRRSKEFNRQAKKQISDDLYLVYRAKADEAYSIYGILLNMKKEAMRENKPNVGEWRQVSEKYPKYVCTACDHLGNNKEYSYCPWCGAKMKGSIE